MLSNFYNINTKKSIVLDDATNIESFKNIKIKKIFFNCVYIGSFFFEGKGIEQILR